MALDLRVDVADLKKFVWLVCGFNVEDEESIGRVILTEAHEKGLQIDE